LCGALEPEYIVNQCPFCQESVDVKKCDIRQMISLLSGSVTLLGSAGKRPKERP